MTTKIGSDIAYAYGDGDIDAITKKMDYSIKIMREDSIRSPSFVPIVEGNKDLPVEAYHNIFSDMSQNYTDLSAQSISFQSMYNLNLPYSLKMNSSLIDARTFDANEMVLSQNTIYAIGTVVSATLLVAAIYISGTASATTE